MGKTALLLVRKTALKIVLSLAIIAGIVSAAVPAEAFHTYCTLYWNGVCVGYGSSAPDTLEGARDCTYDSGVVQNNEINLYTGTNYTGYCMAFRFRLSDGMLDGYPPRAGAANLNYGDLNPSGWHPPTSYTGWRISSMKKGADIRAAAGVAVCSGTYHTGACALVTWTAPDMTGMDIRSLYVRG
jgi:hypothetical protein